MSAARQNPYAALAEDQQVADVAPAAADAASAYTPVASTVKSLHQRITSNGLVRSSLSKLQQVLPTAVSEQAVAVAGQAQTLGVQLATPLVNRVDSKMSDYILRLLALPAYGQAKVLQADQLAFSYTPEALKPTYTATRSRVTSAVSYTADQVQRVRSERTLVLWHALEQVQAQIERLKASVSATSMQARSALHLQQRLSDLSAKVTEALALASKKADQARAASREVLASVGDLTTQLTAFLETQLSESQRDTIRSVWQMLVQRAYALQASLAESLHLGGALPSYASSRSNSNASSSSNLDSEGSVEGEAAAVPVSSAPGVHATSTGEIVIVEESHDGGASSAATPPSSSVEEESDSKVAAAKPKKRAHVKSAGKKNSAASAAAEEKSKIDADME